IIGNTIVLRDGKPWLSLGTPGNVNVTVAQVLSNVLDHGMEPYEASVAPRMLALRDDYVLEIESRIPPKGAARLPKMAIPLSPLPHGPVPDVLARPEDGPPLEQHRPAAGGEGGRAVSRVSGRTAKSRAAWASSV